jgi:hypothetical protein
MSLVTRSKAVKAVKASKKTKIVAKRITNDNATNQLDIFTQSFGVKEKTTLYMYGKHVYINADLILPVLSVDETAFKKSARNYAHYIVIKKKLYVNKYGLTKLLAASEKEAVYMLQDYIFEVIYKIETEGSNAVEYVDSHEQLCMKMAELEVQDMALITNKKELQDMADHLLKLSSDYSVVESENTKLKKTVDDLQYMLDNSKSDYSSLFKQTKKLARCVRFNTALTTNEVDELDSSGDELTENMVDMDKVVSRGMDAKRSICAYSEIGRSRSAEAGSPELKKGIKNLYYLMQSVESVNTTNGAQLYTWQIGDRLPGNNDILFVEEHKYNSFKEFSEDYRLGGIDSGGHTYIWASDLIVNQVLSVVLKKILDLMQYLDYESCMRIIEIFESDSN